jgi:hypothetical protein
MSRHVILKEQIRLFAGGNAVGFKFVEDVRRIAYQPLGKHHLFVPDADSK